MLVTIRVPNKPAAMNALLEGMVRTNIALMRAAELIGQPIPPLFASGVRYKREPEGREWWQTVTDTLQEGSGDCEDLATWLAAELRLRYGVRARAVTVRTGPRMFHAIVRLPDDRIVDPSMLLIRRQRTQRNERRRRSD